MTFIELTQENAPELYKEVHPYDARIFRDEEFPTVLFLFQAIDNRDDLGNGFYGVSVSKMQRVIKTYFVGGGVVNIQEWENERYATFYPVGENLPTHGATFDPDYAQQFNNHHVHGIAVQVWRDYLAAQAS